MKYIDDNGRVVTKPIIKAENPNVSFPKVWDDSTLEGLPYSPVMPTEVPTPGDYEVVEAAQPIQTKGVWYEQWAVVPMFTATAEATVEQQIAEYEAQKLQQERQGMTVSNENLRLQLDQIGVYGVMSAAVATLDATAEANGVDVTPYSIHWGFATTINRLDEWVNEVAKAANVTDEQLDELFEAAS